MPLGRDPVGRRLQRQGCRRHDHRADRAACRHGLCLRAGYAARRSQLRKPHDFGGLHRRPGRQGLCRAHRNPRQRADARLCDPPRVRRQRGRRLQPGAGPARQEAPGRARFLRDGRDRHGAGYGAGPGHPGRRCRREVDRRVFGRCRLFDGRRQCRTVDRRRDHRAELPRTRPVHQVLGRRRQGFARFQLSFTEPYFLGRRISAGFDIYKRTRSYNGYESDTTGATIRFGLPITENMATFVAYNLSRKTTI